MHRGLFGQSSSAKGRKILSENVNIIMVTYLSLDEYILIDPRRYYVEQYHRQSNNQWILSSHENTESVVIFKSIDFRCELIDLYEDVIFDPQ